MAKRRTPPPQKKRPTPLTPPPATMPTPSDSQPVVKRHIKTVALRIGSSLIDSIVDRAFGLLLLGVGFIMTPIAIAIWLYIQRGRATWVYPYLNFTLGFITACLVLIVAASLLFYVQARRCKLLENAKNLKFISHEKGFLDHKVNLHKALGKFVAAMNVIGSEHLQISQTSGQAATKLTAAESVYGARGDALRIKIASQTATKFNKHSVNMERRLVELEYSSTLLFESSVGWLTWATSQAEYDRKEFSGVRSSLVNLLGDTRTSITTTGVMRKGLDNLRNMNMSQDLNTAVNRMSYVIDGVVAALQNSENHWKELIRILDR